MKNFTQLTFDMWYTSKDAKSVLDSMTMRLIKEARNPDISQTVRLILQEDVQKLLKIQEQIRNLNVIQLFHEGKTDQDLEKIKVDK